jgi:hypothetical protein
LGLRRVDNLRRLGDLGKPSLAGGPSTGIGNVQPRVGLGHYFFLSVRPSGVTNSVPGASFIAS